MGEGEEGTEVFASLTLTYIEGCSQVHTFSTSCGLRRQLFECDFGVWLLCWLLCSDDASPVQKCNEAGLGKVLANKDAVFVLAYSIIMLNVVLHSTKVKESMTLQVGHLIPSTMSHDIYSPIPPPPSPSTISHDMLSDMSPDPCIVTYHMTICRQTPPPSHPQMGTKSPWLPNVQLVPLTSAE